MGAEGSEGHRSVDEMTREIEELRASRARLARAADDERRAIERSLHRGVQQDLVGLAANLEVVAGMLDADPAAVKRTLDELREEAGRALTEIQELAARIFPPLLEAGGLVPELRATASRARVRIEIDASTTGGLPQEIAAAVYFCVRDVLDRSPAGTSTRLSVRDEEGAIGFEIVADSDLGTDRRVAHDRVEALGGAFTITAADGRTTIVGSLPTP
jgi:signal transduction histidine kinase